MFEDELIIEDNHNTYYFKPTEVVVDVQTSMYMPRQRDSEAPRIRPVKTNPDDVFKILLPNTFQAS